MSNSSIWPTDRTLSGATTPGQSGAENNDIKRDTLYSTINDWQLVVVVSGEVLPSPEIQSVYSTAWAYWAVFDQEISNGIHNIGSLKCGVVTEIIYDST